MTHHRAFTGAVGYALPGLGIFASINLILQKMALIGADAFVDMLAGMGVRGAYALQNPNMSAAERLKKVERRGSRRRGKGRKRVLVLLIEQNPVVEGTTRNPDYRIEGEIFDCYSPAKNTKVRNIASTIEEKVIKKGQTKRVVLNLNDWSGDVAALVKQLNDYPIEGDDSNNIIIDICDVCFWQYDEVAQNVPDNITGANKVSLNMAKNNFKLFGVVEKRFLDMVRPPYEDEL